MSVEGCGLPGRATVGPGSNAPTLAREAPTHVPQSVRASLKFSFLHLLLGLGILLSSNVHREETTV